LEIKIVRFDRYIIVAQFFPALITSLPIIVLTFFLIEDPQAEGLVNYILNIKFATEITITIAILFLFSQLIRITSKYFQNKYFISSKGFPTTYLLTYADNTFSNSLKDAFRIKVEDKFNFRLLSSSEETTNQDEANKLIDESIRQINVVLGDNKLIKWHNIWYGFIRNTIGGVVFGLFFGLLGILFGVLLLHEPLLVYVSISLCILYLGIFLFRKPLMVQVAEDYAKKLITEFMATQK